MQHADQYENPSPVHPPQTTQQMKHGYSGTGDAARFTIGFMRTNVVAPWEQLGWNGAMDAARDRNVNLICFAGEAFRNPFGFKAQANIVYDLINGDRLDGLILWIGYTYLNEDEIHAFYHQQRYASLPKVTIERVVEGFPSIQGDNYLSMQTALRHLIEGHGYRRIAFIQGTEHHFGIQERYRAYRETLAEYGIPFDPSLVRLFYTETMRSEEVTQWLLDEQPAPVEALVGHNDGVTLLAIKALQARGVRIPHDLAIVGFDNIEESRTTFPALTTVEPPFYDMGRKAVEILVASIEGQPVPERTVLSGSLVIRQSCGCRSQQVAQASVAPLPIATTSIKQVLRAQRESILAEIRQTVGVAEKERDWLTPLLDGFERELFEGAPGVFLQAIEAGLSSSLTTDGTIAEWQGVLSTLRRRLLPCLSEGPLVSRAENLWQQARVVISEAIEGYRMNQAFQSNRQMQLLREIGSQLITTFEVTQLMAIMAEQLPQVGIPGCYLALYEDPQSYAYPQPVPQWSRLMLAYNEHGRVQLESQGRRFKSQELFPADILLQEDQNNLLVKPLYFQTQQIGFVVFEVGSKEGHIYEALCSQVSSALQGAMLVQRMERRSTQLQTAAEVSRATSSILNLDELLPQAIELIRDRFNLYYVGLFLVEDPRQGMDETSQSPGHPSGVWAVLRAGTGEPGRKMLEAGHKLEIGGASMIGSCVAQGKAGVALDVEKAIRYKNPHLPETRSEMALPLINRGRAIGAMTIQSAQPAAFTQDDITTLQTMADQLANAIENAVLFDESKQARLLLDQRVKGLDCLNDIGRKLEEAVPIPDFLQWVTERVPPIMQYPDLCVVAIEYRGQVYGVPAALALPRQVVQGLRSGDALIGRVCIAYTEEHDFLDEESALLGDIARRVNSYLENQRLLSETQARARREQILREITARVRSSTDPDTVMRTLAGELGTALGKA
jgi:DNA-binding LacI/PurR family transcriptional regulator/GAF domain-containing protein